MFKRGEESLKKKKQKRERNKTNESKENNEREKGGKMLSSEKRKLESRM